MTKLELAEGLLAVAGVVIAALVAFVCVLVNDKDYWKGKYDEAEGKRRKLFLEQLDLLEEMCDIDDNKAKDDNVVFLDPRRR